MTSRKTRKTCKTPEEIVNGWMAKQAKNLPEGTREYVRSNWEPGQVAHLFLEETGCNYECFELPTGGYVVIEWDDHGNITF